MCVLEKVPLEICIYFTILKMFFRNFWKVLLNKVLVNSLK